MISEPCGVIVKYNPCTVYARLGSPCPYYDSGRKCGKLPNTCESLEYDLWYKTVLNTGTGTFYPNRIKILETPGTPMFLYHTDKHAIMGEAEIQTHHKDNDEYHYNFNEFHQYPHPVELELITQDPRLAKLAKIGLWPMVYINKETIQTIRKLAKLSKTKRRQLDKNLAQIIIELEKKPERTSKPTWKQVLESHKQKHLKQGINKNILDQVTEKLEEASKQGLIKGRSTEYIYYALLYLACRQTDTPKTIDEIKELGNLEKNKLTAHIRLLLREMNLKSPRIKPKDLIQSMTKNIPKNITQKAAKIAERISSKRSAQGKAPSSIAAVSTYIACTKEDYPITQKEIAEIYNTTTVTISKHYKEHT